METLDSVLEQYAYSEHLLNLLLRVSVLFPLLFVVTMKETGRAAIGQGVEAYP